MTSAFAKTFQIMAVAITLAGASVLAARPAVQTPGPTLQDRIEFGLDTSSVVKRYDLSVKVNGSEAILTGTVATDAQKAEAARLAKVAGAKTVQNDIVVDKNVDTTLAERLKTGLSKTGDKITDVWITTKVKWFFWGDERLKGSKIDVDTNNGVVTLKGTVPTQAGRTRAVSLATNTEGVKRVVDELTIPR